MIGPPVCNWLNVPLRAPGAGHGSLEKFLLSGVSMSIRAAICEGVYICNGPPVLSTSF